MKKGSTSLLVSVVLLVCGVALGKKKPLKKGLGTELGKAPAAVRSWKNPYAGQTEGVLAGEKLFRQHCAACHGLDGRGRDKAPNLHSPEIQSASPGALVWFLKNGNLREGMPSWSGLPDQQRWQLVTYLQTLR